MTINLFAEFLKTCFSKLFQLDTPSDSIAEAGIGVDSGLAGLVFVTAAVYESYTDL